MTLQTFNGALWVPAPQPGLAGSFGLGSFVIDAAGEKVSVTFQVPKTGTISKVGFRVGAVTTAETLRAGLYTTDASGLPTATAYGGMTVGTQATPAANTAYTVPLGTGAAATIGDIVSAVIEFDVTVGNLAINAITGSFSTSTLFPYMSHYTTAWAKQVSVPLFWIEYSDGTYAYIPNSIPASAVSEVTFNSGTAGADEYGLRFSLPFPARLCGFGGFFSQGAALEAILYEGTTALSTTALAANQVAASAARYQARPLVTPYTLARNTVYRFALRPTTTGGIVLAYYDVLAAAIFNQVDGGADYHMAQRLDQGAWTDTPTRRPLLFLMFDQFDDGVSAGGGPAPMLRSY